MRISAPARPSVTSAIAANTAAATQAAAAQAHRMRFQHLIKKQSVNASAQSVEQTGKGAVARAVASARPAQKRAASAGPHSIACSALMMQQHLADQSAAARANIQASNSITPSSASLPPVRRAPAQLSTQAAAAAAASRPASQACKPTAQQKAGKRSPTPAHAQCLIANANLAPPKARPTATANPCSARPYHAPTAETLCARKMAQATLKAAQAKPLPQLSACSAAARPHLLPLPAAPEVAVSPAAQAHSAHEGFHSPRVRAPGGSLLAANTPHMPRVGARPLQSRLAPAMMAQSAAAPTVPMGPVKAFAPGPILAAGDKSSAQPGASSRPAPALAGNAATTPAACVLPPSTSSLTNTGAAPGQVPESQQHGGSMQGADAHTKGSTANLPAQAHSGHSAGLSNDVLPGCHDKMQTRQQRKRKQRYLADSPSPKHSHSGSRRTAASASKHHMSTRWRAQLADATDRRPTSAANSRPYDVAASATASHQLSAGQPTSAVPTQQQSEVAASAPLAAAPPQCAAPAMQAAQIAPHAEVTTPSPPQNAQPAQHAISTGSWNALVLYWNSETGQQHVQQLHAARKPGCRDFVTENGLQLPLTPPSSMLLPQSTQKHSSPASGKAPSSNARAEHTKAETDAAKQPPADTLSPLIFTSPQLQAKPNILSQPLPFSAGSYWDLLSSTDFDIASAVCKPSPDDTVRPLFKPSPDAAHNMDAAHARGSACLGLQLQLQRSEQPPSFAPACQPCSPALLPPCAAVVTSQPAGSVPCDSSAPFQSPLPGPLAAAASPTQHTLATVMPGMLLPSAETELCIYHV